MSKQEITAFVNKYIQHLKCNYAKSILCHWLENATDFEAPDGYYFDAGNKLLVIFEHFEIDCSERPVSNGRLRGSLLHKNIIDVQKEINREIGATNVGIYKSIKVIEQGYFEQEGNRKTFRLGENGDKYRKNYINNFYKSFDGHCRKIEKYKNNLIKDLNVHPCKTIVCFLIEDKTLGGSFYLSDRKQPGNPVILTETLQFQLKINRSEVNYVILGRESDGLAFIGCAGENEKDKVDLNTKELFIFPAMPQITTAKKTIVG